MSDQKNQNKEIQFTGIDTISPTANEQQIEQMNFQTKSKQKVFSESQDEFYGQQNQFENEKEQNQQIQEQELQPIEQETSPKELFGEVSPASLTKKQGFYRSKLYYYFYQLTVMLNFALSQNLVTLYNTMSTHLRYIFDWSESEEDIYIGLINSITVVGAVLGIIIVGSYKAKIGRRIFLMIGAGIAIIGSIFCQIVFTPTFLFGRFLHGLAIGINQNIGPLFVREISIPENKGNTGIVQVVILQIGIFSAAVLGFGLPDDKETSESKYWRVMAACPLIFAIFQICMFFFIFTDDSPTFTYQITNRDEEKTKQALQKIFSTHRASEEFDVIKTTNLRQQSCKEITFKELFKNYRSQLLVIFLMCLLWHASAIQAMLVYSNKIIEEADSNKTATLFTSLGSVANITGIFIQLYLTDSIGRKKNYLISAVLTTCILYGYMICSFIDGARKAYKYLYLAIRFGYGLGIGPLYYSYMPDILPLAGITLIQFLFQFLSFVVFQAFWPMESVVGLSGLFAFFSISSTILLILINWVMKETKYLNKDQVYQQYLKKK